MAQCPMTSSWTNDFHTNCIVNGTGNIRDIIDFNQSFVGGSSGGPVDDDSWNSSFHGYQEAVGDTYFLCARYYEDVDSGGLSGEYKWLDFVACMNGVDGLAGIEFIPGNAGRCGKEVSRRATEREAQGFNARRFCCSRSDDLFCCSSRSAPPANTLSNRYWAKTCTKRLTLV